MNEFLSHLARRMGKLKKGEHDYMYIYCHVGPLAHWSCDSHVMYGRLAGGIPDVGAAAKSVLRDWNT